MTEQLLQQKSKFNKIIAEYKKFIDEQLNEKEKILQENEEKDREIASLKTQ